MQDLLKRIVSLCSTRDASVSPQKMGGGHNRQLLTGDHGNCHRDAKLTKCNPHGDAKCGVRLAQLYIAVLKKSMGLRQTQSGLRNQWHRGETCCRWHEWQMTNGHILVGKSESKTLL